MAAAAWRRLSRRWQRLRSGKSEDGLINRQALPGLASTSATVTSCAAVRMFSIFMASITASRSPALYGLARRGSGCTSRPGIGESSSLEVSGGPSGGIRGLQLGGAGAEDGDFMPRPPCWMR